VRRVVKGFTVANDIITVLSDFGPLLVHKNDTHIGKSIIDNGYWEKEEILFLADLVSKLYANFDRISIFDIGANIGTYTLAFSKIFGAKATIYSFEAQRIVFQQLAGNCAINSLKQVHAFNNVVSDTHLELVKFATHDYSTFNINFGGLEIEPALHSDNLKEHHVIPESAYSIRLDELEVDNLALMKIDIEGMEHKALAGAQGLIAKYRPIIFYEYFKTDNVAILEMLRQHNYTVYKLPHANALAVRAELNLGLNFERFF
jgi:FkbM family methyltransferase